MADRATPNLPSRDFDATISFYAALGFARAWRDEQWLILARGALTLEFFPHPDLDPRASWFSCCLRLDDADALLAVIMAVGVPEASSGLPRFHALSKQPWGGRMGALTDPDGTLVRLIQN